MDKGSKKFICPECNQKRFVRYIDIETNSYLPDNVGRCDRQSSCGCWNKPKIEAAEKQPVNYYFVPFDKIIDHSTRAYKIITANGLFFLPKATVYEVAEKGCYVAEWFLKEVGNNKKPLHLSNDFKSILEGEAVAPAKHINIPATAPKPISFIDTNLFKASLRNYETNHFVQYLISLFGNDVAKQLVSKYFIGTSKHWQGANVFWQIDMEGRIRTGKIMLYSPTTGKRVKEPDDCISWAHKALNQADFELNQCLFGSHLLKDKTKPVALCESEKTAIIASVYYPKFIWVAAGGADGLSIAKCESLNRHRKPVILFPDISATKDFKQSTFEKWQAIAKKHLLKYTFSTLLEGNASESDKAYGLDLADYLIKYDYREFTEQEQQGKERLVNGQNYQIGGHITHFSENKTEVECLASIEKITETKANSYSIEKMKNLAISQLNKYPMFKDKVAASPAYFTAWARDMSEVIRAAGTTEKELLKTLLFSNK